MRFTEEIFCVMHPLHLSLGSGNTHYRYSFTWQHMFYVLYHLMSHVISLTICTYCGCTAARVYSVAWMCCFCTLPHVGKTSAHQPSSGLVIYQLQTLKIDVVQAHRYACLNSNEHHSDHLMLVQNPSLTLLPYGCSWTGHREHDTSVEKG